MYKKTPFDIPKLPPEINLETTSVLRKAAQAHRFLAELKGVSGTIPNQNILINTLSLQEAKDSSAIENIVTTHHELFQQDLFARVSSNAAAKEVQRYVVAIKKGYKLVESTGHLTTTHIKTIQAELEGNSAGFRKIPGTELKNDQTGETVYVPPQHVEDIQRLMANLEVFINDDELSELDPLVKMAVIHYQFESIHPFYDGNGRTGRIINILYLVQKGLLNIPALYLSRYIIQSKSEYYRRLQSVRETGDWEKWILYMLDGVEKTSRQTIAIVQKIRDAMLDYKHRIRADFKFYSQDLLNNLFSHPYTRIEFLRRDLDVTRLTATRYLDALTRAGFLQKRRAGTANFYINPVLYELLTNVPNVK